MKKKLLLFLIFFLLVSCGKKDTLKPYPAPELDSGMRGETFGIDKNVNEKTVDEYLGREDTVYRDMRMLKDEANYEAIGGDSYLSGLVEGFEVVPYPYLVNVEGLPEEVGAGYQGETLFTQTENGYTANYEESMEILEDLFPKDKTILLMCGGGGYAGMTKGLLTALGWDPSKIYNTGGYWYYEGEHKLEVKREENGEIYYDFHKVPYHLIDFSVLHKIGEGSHTDPDPQPYDPATEKLPFLTTEEINEKTEKGDLFALYISLPGCTSCAAFSPFIKEYAKKGLIDIYEESYPDIVLDDTILRGLIEYAPSVAVIEDGKIKALLRSNVDEDKPVYTSLENLTEWFAEKAGIEECEGACKLN